MKEVDMIDIVLRDCGHGEWLPIIKATDSGVELYRGERKSSPEAALSKAIAVWEAGGTGNVVKFRQANGL
jgi:hypothetical protein